MLPIDPAGDGLGVGIDQQLGRIEAQAARRVPRAVDAIAVELTRLQARNVTMPDEGGLLGQLNASRSRDDYGRRTDTARPWSRFPNKGEIDAGSVPGGAGETALPGKQGRSILPPSMWQSRNLMQIL